MEVITEEVTVPAEKIRTKLLESIREAAAGVVNLEDAEVIVAGGRGMGGPENFKLCEELVEALAVCRRIPQQMLMPDGLTCTLRRPDR